MENNKKEIEIMPFMIRDAKEKNKQMVNSSQRDPLNNEILGKGELYLRKINNTHPEKRQIFNESDETDRVYKENIKTEKKDKKDVIKVYAGIAVIAAIVLVIEGAVKYESKPIRKTVIEMAADTGLYEIEHDKIDGNMTQEELVDYAIKNNLTMEELDKQIAKFCDKEWLAEDVVREKMEETNPGVFKNIR